MIIASSVPMDVLIVNITPNGNNTAGNSFTLNCTVQKKSQGLLNSPVIIWTVDGETVAEPETFSIDNSINGISILRFNPLMTSHAGNYTCRGLLHSPALSAEHPIESSLENHLEVKSKSSYIYQS